MAADPVDPRDHHGQEPIASIQPDHLRLKAARTGGQSGGQYFFCPSNNIQTCGGGQKGYVYGGHWFGLFQTTYRVAAAKVSTFRTEAMAWMNN